MSEQAMASLDEIATATGRRVPDIESEALQIGVERSVEDISHYTAPDLRVWEPRKYSVHAPLLPQYLDELC